MAFWIFMFLSVLLIPGIMLGVGLWFRKTPPGKINYIWGYRTTMSMKNQDTWDFAHRKCGDVWTKWSLWLLIPSGIPMLFVMGKDMGTVGNLSSIIVMVQLIPLLASIYPVEKALRDSFDQDGNRKNS